MSTVTVENQRDLLGKVQTLSKAALDVYVKDLKSEKMEGLHKPKSEQIGLSVQTENLNMTHIKANLKLDEVVLKQLPGIQNKGIDLNDTIFGKKLKGEKVNARG